MQQVHTIPSPPARPDDAHKGTFGTVIVVGGCETMLGAPAMCARAALRSGAGLVKVACPPSVLGHVLTIEPSATGIALAEDATDYVEAAQYNIDRADPECKAVLAVGPGMGLDRHRQALVLRLLAGPRGVVLDADGLNHLAISFGDAGDNAKCGSDSPALRSNAAKGRPADSDKPPARVLTPHPGEFRRLAGPLGITADPTIDEQRPDAAEALALALDAVVVLKGKGSVVTDGQRYFVNTTGNPAMAAAGSGDVLTGLIASLVAQGMDGFDAAVLGTHAHGLAADYWAKQHGPSGLRAMELADAIPGVLWRLG